MAEPGHSAERKNRAPADASRYEQVNMRKDVLKINDRPLGEMLDNFFICEHCMIVDKDSGRTEHGHKCSNCNNTDDRGLSYFSTQVTSLINLMQEFYHTQQVITDENGKGHVSFWAGHVKLPVIIFFATLRELLLNNLIDEIFKARSIDGDICDRLLKDSPTHKQRLDNLFRTLTGEKWKAALTQIDKDEGTDFVSLDTFIVKVVRARNDFLHNGNTWEIKDNMAEDCMINIYPMLELHAHLHNHFVFIIYDFEKEE